MLTVTSSTASPAAVAKIGREVRRVVCSAPWFDACLNAFDRGRVRAKKQIAVALDHAGVYPPGGTSKSLDHPTLMRRCSECGSTWYPPQYLIGGSGVCLDCAAGAEAPYTDERTHRSTTSSPSAAAIEAMGFRRQRLVELRLPADDESSLRREIRAGTTGSSFGHKKHKKTRKR